MRCLVIGDIHEPVSHPAYLQFCKDLYEEWDCNQVVFIGDVADHHAISFHAANPECPGPNDEAKLTLVAIQKWYKAFPKAKVTIGNHDARVLRLAETVKISKRFIRSYNESWDTPNWEWAYSFNIDGVVYIHGTGRSGVHPAWNAVNRKMKSVVMGHCHSRAGVKWKTTEDERYFGMDVGCGIDPKAWQFVYNKDQDERPTIAAGVVINGFPYSEIMPCTKGEPYHRSGFE